MTRSLGLASSAGAESPAPLSTPVAPLSPPSCFVNPIAEGADPWVVLHEKFYYFCHTEGHDGIAVCKSPRLTQRGVKCVVWRPRRRAWNRRDIWAPELHHISGRWYIYYCASNGKNENHRAGVLRAMTDDPQGEYEDLGVLYTGDQLNTGKDNRWAIDATPLRIGDQLYLIWSGWPDTNDVHYMNIATMANPWTVSSNRVKLCENNCYDWERVNNDPAERGLHEGPQILRRDGKTFLVYSCSSSWDPTYTAE